MLRIFNNLNPFFEDVYREISVREYGRITGVSGPTASVILKNLANEGILVCREERRHLLFRANKENHLFKDLSIAYWKDKIKSALQECGLIEKLFYPKIILFGSITKIENKENSDIDLFIDINLKEIDTECLEKKLKRKIQLHFKNSLKNKHLKNNIERGILIS